MVGLLLKAGADPTLEDDQGCDARAIALDRGHGAVVALIDVSGGVMASRKEGLSMECNNVLTISPSTNNYYASFLALELDGRRPRPRPRRRQR